MTELRDNSGFIRPFKRTTDKQPSEKGTCVVGGVKYNVSIWPAKVGEDGSEYRSIKFDIPDPSKLSLKPKSDEAPF